ncbi:hypothetical protein EJ110_NYTH18289 [Nymphaea thermarum]|nr:hypothetical protein EJ110_NYTH18289 [Nymphaea thermarum]
MASAGPAISAHAALPALQVRVLFNGRSLLSSRNCRGATSRIPSLSPGALRLGKSPPARRMTVRAARTESGGMALGFRAPEFELPEPLTGKLWKLEDFETYPALLKNLAIVAISSNSVETHPQDGPKLMAEEAKLFGYPFPYLYDESQDVARAFGAVCTPEFLLFKKDGRRPFELFYHGQFDDSRPGNGIPVTGRNLSLAIDCVLSGQSLSAPQKPR